MSGATSITDPRRRKGKDFFLVFTFCTQWQIIVFLFFFFFSEDERAGDGETIRISLQKKGRVREATCQAKTTKKKEK